jgi:hypothetical protein
MICAGDRVAPERSSPRLFPPIFSGSRALWEVQVTANKRPISFIVTAIGCFDVTSHYRDSKGRPTLWHNGVPLYAHRHIWQECFGEIPDGICVLHRCDNPACINPEHLFLGTKTDNARDRDAKGRQAHLIGESNGCAKLTEGMVREVRRRYRIGDRRDGCRPLAREFGVEESTMRNAIRGTTWRHIEAALARGKA